MQRSVREVEFTEYVAARRAQLRRTAYLLCGDSHRAEDLVQVALVRLYGAWPRLRRDHDHSVDAYARRIVVNAHLDETRRGWRRERVGLDLFGAEPSTQPGQDAVEERDELIGALQQLPEGQRRVVVLRHYWGLSVQETARDLGISAGTVKSQTSAGLAGLHRLLSTTNHDRSHRVP